MKKWLIVLIALFSVLLVTACGDSDELSGKTFDISVKSSPDNPEKYHTIMTLEFSDGNVITNSIDGEKGTYELKNNKLVIWFENENESLEIEFTLEESDKEFSKYLAEISDSNFQMEDPEQVSKYKGFYLDLPKSYVEFVEIF